MSPDDKGGYHTTRESSPLKQVMIVERFLPQYKLTEGFSGLFLRTHLIYPSHRKYGSIETRKKVMMRLGRTFFSFQDFPQRNKSYISTSQRV